MTLALPHPKDPGSRRLVIRYSLIAASTVLILALALVAGIGPEADEYFIPLWISVASAGLYALYIVPVLVLRLSGSTWRFDLGAVELTYLSLQIACWICGTIFSALFTAILPCPVRHLVPYSPPRTGYYYHYTYPPCARLVAHTFLGFCHLALLVGWMVWFILTVQRAHEVPSSTGFRLPVDVVLRGGEGLRVAGKRWGATAAAKTKGSEGGARGLDEGEGGGGGDGGDGGVEMYGRGEREVDDEERTLKDAPSVRSVK